MASPTLDLLCCAFQEGKRNVTLGARHDHSDKKEKQLLTLGYIFFTSLFLSSLVSVIGTAVTLWPKRGNPRTRSEAVADDRQRIILSWLASADVAACIGILIFSFYCIMELQEYVSGSEGRDDDSDAESVVCVIFTAWVQFFYLATYFWTLFYALDVYLMLRGVKKKFLFALYFLLTWFLSAIIIIVSLLSFYERQGEGMKCKVNQEQTRNFGFIWGSYIALLLVYVSMPVLYFLSSRMIKPMLQRTGVYTNRERKVKAQIQKKFMRIIVVFIVCWAPNILNGFLQFYLAVSGNKWTLSFMVPIWLLMSLLNPMQAFLNALVYWGPAGCTRVRSESDDRGSPRYRDTDELIFSDKMAPRASLNTAVLSNGEQTPLLRSMKM